MTEYSMMSDDELRIAVAKALGWQFMRVTERSLRAYPIKPGESSNGYYPSKEGDEIVFANEYDYCDPDWPTSIAAAWELVEEAAQDGVGMDLFTIHEDNHFWYRTELFDPPGGPMPEVYSAESESAPRAICVAWLKWKEAKG
jgi:hypothetical protein